MSWWLPVLIQAAMSVLEAWLGKTKKTEAGSVIEAVANAVRGKKI